MARHEKIAGPIKVKDGYLYYIKKNGEVWGSPMKNNQDKRAKPYYTGVKVKRDKNYLYFVKKDGYVYRVKRKNV